MAKITSRQGFTLIELLVVIVILAILIAILLPIYVSARENGRQTACINNLYQLSRAMRLYADNHNGDLPSANFAANDYGGVPGVGFVLETGQIWQYVKKRELYLCPSDRGVVAPRDSGLGTNHPLSYSLNTRASGTSMEKIRNPSKVILLIHERRDAINDGSFVYYGTIDRQTNVHHRGACGSYCDLHVKWKHYNVWEAERTSPSDPWNPASY